jgi:uncharacterized protein
MLKLVVVVVAVVALLWLLFGRTAPKDGPKRDARRHAPGGAEDMVVCAHCGVHVPRSEALAARGLHFCSAAHRDGAPSRPR